MLYLGLYLIQHCLQFVPRLTSSEIRALVLAEFALHTDGDATVNSSVSNKLSYSV